VSVCQGECSFGRVFENTLYTLTIRRLKSFVRIHLFFMISNLLSCTCSPNKWQSFRASACTHAPIWCRILMLHVLSACVIEPPEGTAHRQCKACQCNWRNSHTSCWTDAQKWHVVNLPTSRFAAFVSGTNRTKTCCTCLLYVLAQKVRSWVHMVSSIDYPFRVDPKDVMLHLHT